jgi:hypothetical protein
MAMQRCAENARRTSKLISKGARQSIEHKRAGYLSKKLAVEDVKGLRQSEYGMLADPSL